MTTPPRTVNNNNQSWLQLLKSQNLNKKRNSTNSKPKHSTPRTEKEKPVEKPGVHGNIKISTTTTTTTTSNIKKKVKRTKPATSSSTPVLKRNKKTKFKELLQREEDTTSKGTSTSAQDLELEKKLAKNLKVKTGKLRGYDDVLNSFLDDIPYVCDDASLDRLQEVPDSANFTNKKSSDPKTEFQNESDVSKKHTKKKKKDNKPTKELVVEAPAVASSVKYIAPHLRARARNESEDHTQFCKQLRGLLNRLSESNVESITGEISTIFRTVTRTVGTQIITEEVLASCSSGPRGNEHLILFFFLYAAIFAAFVVGMACSIGIDFGAKILASVAKCFEDSYHNQDDHSLRNITLLLSYLCIFGLCTSDLIYDFLITLSQRLTEIDVSTILTVMQYCGMKIRADDPAAMKNFIVSIQNRVSKLKEDAVGQANKNGKRMEFMLETLCDIKNNKKRPKEETAQHTRIKKWLQKLRVVDILLRGITWSKLLDPDKKGQWWLTGELAATIDNNVEVVANTIDKEVLEAQKMMQLASAQRMNSDIGKAIFCIIMSGEDYIDAFEKLLRFDLQGKQDREIIRVLVNCCLQEKVFNKYYTVLASKLCEHDKNHKFTLQVVWNIFTRVAITPELETLRDCMELFIKEHVLKSSKNMNKKFKLVRKALGNVEGVLM
ncbi:hypothetical protein ACFE04_027812 [Oxalis oulophora]